MDKRTGKLSTSCFNGCSEPAFSSKALHFPKFFFLFIGVLFMSGALFGAPPHETALELDGENDGVEIPDSEQSYQHLLEGEGVIEFWCRPRLITKSDSHSDRQFAVSFAGTVDGDHRDINIGIHNAGHWWIIMSDSTGYVAQASCSREPIQEGKWYHVAVILGDDDRGFYLNGEKVGSWDEFSGSTGLWENNLHFGYAPRRDRDWHGMLSEMRIWDVNLSAEDINARMNQKLDGNEEGLVGYWPMSGEDNEDAVPDLAADKGGRYVGNPGWSLARPFSVDISNVMVEEADQEEVTLGPVELQAPEGEVLYQWYYDGSPIEGETGPTLKVRDISYLGTGRYYVVVDDDRDVTPVESRRARVMRKHEIKSEVEPVDWKEISPEMVEDDRNVYFTPHHFGASFSLSYYLEYFHRLANAVREQEPNRGFIDGHFHRSGRDQRTYNARVMESILTLVWFYTKDAPWNPYYADEALRSRLEAAVMYWVDMQNDDGAFSEYGHRRWNLAATAFATKFMGQAMVLLEDGPPIDSLVHQKMRDSMRKAVMCVFGQWWDHARSYTNQYTNAFAGALAYLYLYEDEEMEERLEERMRQAAEEFVSPAGYMYERDGPDWNYYFGTHHSNVKMIWHYGRDRVLGSVEEGDELEEGDWKTFGDIQEEEYRHTTEWLSYNAVPHSGPGGVFYLNRTVETRQRRAALKRLETPLAEVVPLARAFNVTKEEHEELMEESYRKMKEHWGDPPSFQNLGAYAKLHRDHVRWYPSEEQRQEAYEKLPFIAEDRFVHQRVDDRRDQVFTYIRRPGYYVAFNAPTFTSPRGIGLAWHPDFGAVLQSQQDDDFAWGAICLEEDSLLERGSIDPDFLVDGESTQPRAGTRDLPEGEFAISYPMREGERRLQFTDEYIYVSVKDFSSDFAEQIPLLLDEGDELDVVEEDQTVRLIRGGEIILTIEFDGAEEITTQDGWDIEARGMSEPGLHVTTLRASASDGIDYRLSFAGYEE